jgi:hypothetical protein
MNPVRSARPRWLDQRGGVSWVTVLLLACLAAGGYLLWVWGPVYLVHYEVKQVVRDYANQAVKNPSDADLRTRMVHQLATLDRLDAVDGNGRPIQIPAVNVREEEVTWERTQDPPQLHIAFEYTRPVRYPLIDRADETTFDIDGTFDISRADWGKAR